MNQSTITFFDRSLLDSAALLREASIENFHRIKGTIDTHRFNKKVFITPPWKEIYRTDNERDQTYEDSIVVHYKLSNWYKTHGYELKVLPKAAVSVRIDFILQELKQI